MKNVILTFTFVATQILTLTASAQTAQQCNQVSAAINQNSRTLGQCTVDRNKLGAEVQSLIDGNLATKAELNRLKEVRVVQIPSCRRAVDGRNAALNSLAPQLAEMQGKNQEAIRKVKETGSRRAELEAQNFRRWECVIKDKEYGYGGFGTGRTESEAEMNAVGNERTGMANKHKYDKICFAVYKPQT